MSVALVRQCPTCGSRWAGLYCGNDGSVTVLRPDTTDRTRTPLPVGAVIEGRYVLTQVIGRGAFGAVYAADQLTTGQQVAIKVLHTEMRNGSDVARQRFAKEARVLAQLRHPSTVRIYDVGITIDDEPYFVMELVPGLNVEQIFAGLEAAGRRFLEHEAIDLVLPVLGSLAEAHGLGLVHRDIKPANLMVSHVADDGLVVKVVDFGVVRTEGSMLTARASTLGTPRYMSPEQCRGDIVDARSDLYAVGCVLFEAIAGRPPLVARSLVDTVILQVSAPAPSLADVGASASPELEGVLNRLLRKDPAERFASAAELRAALTAIRHDRWRDRAPARIADIHPKFVALTGLTLEGPEGAARRSGIVQSSRTGDRPVAPRGDTRSGGGVSADAAAAALELPEIPTRIRQVDVGKRARSSQSTPQFAAAAPVVEASSGQDAPQVEGLQVVVASDPLVLDLVQRARHQQSRPTLLAWQGDDSTIQKSVSRKPSHRPERLPHPQELEAAIAARQKFLAERAKSRLESDARPEFSDQRLSEAQQALETVDSTQRKPLGRATILGTGLTGRPPRKRDDSPGSN